MSAARAHNARLLRRLTMTTSPDMVETFDDATPLELVDTLLDASPPPADPPALDLEADYWEPTRWWVERMADPAAGLDERMVWFWHGHITSSIDKTPPSTMLDQLGLLRLHARGSFRQMLREVSTDAAMLHWLDGSGSDADAPNENYARELMELFALGRDAGVYDEADVRSGARALAGYWVDDDEVTFDEDAALRGSVPFLGVRVSDVDDVIDAVCDQPECSAHVVSALHEHFVGGPMGRDLRGRMIEALGSGELAIDDALRVLLRDPTFTDGPPLRPRSALEWYLAVQQLVLDPLEFWSLEQLGQVPLRPPNVAGWPGAERWASSGLML
ncbi:MAG: DUF1800 family protein, partial [Ilumatobacter sp.]